MDAILKRFGAILAFTLVATAVQGATFQTANFVVTASDDEIARRVANCAEYWRHELAIQWLGKPLPNWYRPCPISVQVGQMGAGGQTTFTFENGEVYGWKMQVQGTLERVLDSVVPHEVNHTIFASHFRRPLPRWADEGAATLFEHESEQARQMAQLKRVLHTSKRIPLQQLLTIREYPKDMQDVLTLYAEGYSLASYLVGIKGEQGRKVYIQFLEDAHKLGWDQAFAIHYGVNNLDLLESKWMQWIAAGAPPLTKQGEMLAQNNESARNNEQAVAHSAMPANDRNVVIRSQSPQESQPETQTEPALAAVDRAPPPLRAIPRQLRTARPNEGDQSSVSSPQRDAMVDSSAGNWPRSEEFQPRVLRQASANEVPGSPRLSPTAEGVNAAIRREHYEFPEARR
jgi:hypothetical protein